MGKLASSRNDSRNSYSTRESHSHDEQSNWSSYDMSSQDLPSPPSSSPSTPPSSPPPSPKVTPSPPPSPFSSAPSSIITSEDETDRTSVSNILSNSYASTASKLQGSNVDNFNKKHESISDHEDHSDQFFTNGDAEKENNFRKSSGIDSNFEQPSVALSIGNKNHSHLTEWSGNQNQHQQYMKYNEFHPVTPDDAMATNINVNKKLYMQSIANQPVHSLHSGNSRLSYQSQQSANSQRSVASHKLYQSQSGSRVGVHRPSKRLNDIFQESQEKPSSPEGPLSQQNSSLFDSVQTKGISSVDGEGQAPQHSQLVSVSQVKPDKKNPRSNIVEMVQVMHSGTFLDMFSQQYSLGFFLKFKDDNVQEDYYNSIDFIGNRNYFAFITSTSFILWYSIMIVLSVIPQYSDLVAAEAMTLLYIQLFGQIVLIVAFSFFIFTKFFRKHDQIYTSIFALVLGITNLIVLNYIQQVNYVYHVVYILYVFFLFNLHVWYAAGIVLALSVAFCLSYLWTNEIYVILAPRFTVILNVIVIYLFACAAAIYMERRRLHHYSRDRVAAIQQESTHRLLGNLLPATIRTAITDRIADTRHRQPEDYALMEELRFFVNKYPQVTVLFSDLKGFTKFSASVPATALVRILNDIYIMFDLLMGIHHVYKVETIGDAYFVAAGLFPIPEKLNDRPFCDHMNTVDPTHAARVVKLGLDMVIVLQTFNTTSQPLRSVHVVHPTKSYESQYNLTPYCEKEELELEMNRKRQAMDLTSPNTIRDRRILSHADNEMSPRCTFKQDETSDMDQSLLMMVNSPTRAGTLRSPKNGTFGFGQRTQDAQGPFEDSFFSNPNQATTESGAESTASPESQKPASETPDPRAMTALVLKQLLELANQEKSLKQPIFSPSNGDMNNHANQLLSPTNGRRRSIVSQLPTASVSKFIPSTSSSSPHLSGQTSAHDASIHSDTLNISSSGHNMFSKTLRNCAVHSVHSLDCSECVAITNNTSNQSATPQDLRLTPNRSRNDSLASLSNSFVGGSHDQSFVSSTSRAVNKNSMNSRPSNSLEHSSGCMNTPDYVNRNTLSQSTPPFLTLNPLNVSISDSNSSPTSLGQDLSSNSRNFVCAECRFSANTQDELGKCDCNTSLFQSGKISNAVPLPGIVESSACEFPDPQKSGNGVEVSRAPSRSRTSDQQLDRNSMSYSRISGQSKYYSALKTTSRNIHVYKLHAKSDRYHYDPLNYYGHLQIETSLEQDEISSSPDQEQDQEKLVKPPKKPVEPSPMLLENGLEMMQMRIGIHTGSVIGGIVGLKVPRFHLFGETVTVSNLMESSGRPDRVQISHTTLRELERIYNISSTLHDHWVSEHLDPLVFLPRPPLIIEDLKVGAIRHHDHTYKLTDVTVKKIIQRYWVCLEDLKPVFDEIDVEENDQLIDDYTQNSYRNKFDEVLENIPEIARHMARRKMWLELNFVDKKRIRTDFFILPIYQDQLSMDEGVLVYDFQYPLDRHNGFWSHNEYYIVQLMREDESDAGEDGNNTESQSQSRQTVSCDIPNTGYDEHHSHRLETSEIHRPIIQPAFRATYSEPNFDTKSVDSANVQSMYMFNNLEPLEEVSEASGSASRSFSSSLSHQKSTHDSFSLRHSRGSHNATHGSNGQFDGDRVSTPFQSKNKLRLDISKDSRVRDGIVSSSSSIPMYTYSSAPPTPTGSRQSHFSSGHGESVATSQALASPRRRSFASNVSNGPQQHSHSRSNSAFSGEGSPAFGHVQNHSQLPPCNDIPSSGLQITLEQSDDIPDLVVRPTPVHTAILSPSHSEIQFSKVQAMMHLGIDSTHNTPPKPTNNQTNNRITLFPQSTLHPMSLPVTPTKLDENMLSESPSRILKSTDLVSETDGFDTRSQSYLSRQYTDYNQEKYILSRPPSPSRLLRSQDLTGMSTHGDHYGSYSHSDVSHRD